MSNPQYILYALIQKFLSYLHNKKYRLSADEIKNPNLLKSWLISKSSLSTRCEHFAILPETSRSISSGNKIIVPRCVPEYKPNYVHIIPGHVMQITCERYKSPGGPNFFTVLEVWIILTVSRSLTYPLLAHKMSLVRANSWTL